MVQKSTLKAPKKAPPALIGFEKLSEQVLFYEPQGTGTDGNVDEVSSDSSSTIPPRTILLFGWADGQPRHIAKYTDAYKKLYPSARIIVVLSKTMSVFLSTTGATQEAMRPAIMALCSSPHLSSYDTKNSVADGGKGLEPPKGPILIQAFSNGGGINLEAASYCYRSIFGSPLPHSLLIHDSMPGGDSFSAEYNRWALAITTGVAPHLPLPIWFVHGMSILMVCVTIGIPTLFGVENIATVCRRSVLDPTLHDRNAERVYLYSEADDIIGWEAIESGARDAKREGWAVRLEKFEGSGHVAHMRKYPVRYWGIVKESWENAVGRDAVPDDKERIY